MDLMTLIAALKVDDSEFNKGIRKAERNGKKFSDKFEKFTGKARKLLVGAFSAVAVKKAIDGVLGFANSISSLGDQIDKQSQVLGMSRQRYQEWDYILSQTGGNIESMSVSMKTLNNAILEGSKESADAFKTIGLSTKDLAGMSVEDQFEAVVRAFQKLPAGAEKSAAAVKLFGKNGLELLPLLNADVLEIDILRQKAKDLGLIMSDEAVDASVEYQDSLDTLKRTFQGLKNSIGSKILPVLTNAFDRMTQYASKLRKAYDKNGMSGVFDTLWQDIKSIPWPTWDDVKTAFTTAWDTIRNGAKEVMKLIFGETEDGGIAFPTWEQISTAFDSWWNGEGGIKENLENSMKWVLGLFGMPEEEADSIATTVSGWWDKVKATVEDAINWVLNIPNMPPEEAGAKLRELIVTWWDGITDAAEDLLSWVFGIPKPEDADGTRTKTAMSDWWDNTVVPLLKDVFNFTMGLLGLPTADEISQWITDNINKPWDDMVDHLKHSIEPIANFFGVDTSGWFDTPNQAAIDAGKEAFKYFNEIAKYGVGEGDMMLRSKDKYGSYGIAALWDKLANNPELSNEQRYEMLGEAILKNQQSATQAATSMDGLASAAESAAYALMSVGGTDGSHAKGLLTVPYDGYIAKLHRNERILTASQARHQDDGVDSGLLANMIQMLGNKIGNMSIMVGRDEFGRTVVNNSGRRMKGYMGRMTRREAKAYGR